MVDNNYIYCEGCHEYGLQSTSFYNICVKCIIQSKLICKNCSVPISQSNLSSYCGKCWASKMDLKSTQTLICTKCGGQLDSNDCCVNQACGHKSTGHYTSNNIILNMAQPIQLKISDFAIDGGNTNCWVEIKLNGGKNWYLLKSLVLHEFAVTDPDNKAGWYATKEEAIKTIKKYIKRYYINGSQHLFYKSQDNKNMTLKSQMKSPQDIWPPNVWRIFELIDNKHSKFWEVIYGEAKELASSYAAYPTTKPFCYMTRWGRIGTTGTIKPQFCINETTAKFTALDKIKEKLKKGYKEVLLASGQLIVPKISADDDIYDDSDLEDGISEKEYSKQVVKKSPKSKSIKTGFDKIVIKTGWDDLDVSL